MQSVRPFLRNLFNDAAIISAPWPIRPVLAQLISRLRAPKAKRIYSQIGNASPILRNTQDQAAALDEALKSNAGNLDQSKMFRCFVAMRHWRPFIHEAVAKMAAFNPDKIILLPLYPQFSTATTGIACRRQSRASGSRASTRATTSVTFLSAKNSCIASTIATVGSSTRRLRSLR